MNGIHITIEIPKSMERHTLLHVGNTDKLHLELMIPDKRSLLLI